MQAYTYLLINALTLLGPLALSFDRKVAYWKTWKALWPAILLPGAVFIAWDEAFTRLGVWGFNPDYLTGIYLGHLPLEEWLFFVTVPYACVFIYACLKTYLPADPLQPYAGAISWTLTGFLLTVGMLYLNHWYTAVTFLGLAGWLVLNRLVFRTSYLGRFFLAYLIVLIPFLLVNGLLTALPVVVYDHTENLNLRIYTIPVEDSMYGMLLILMNVNVYEWRLQRQGHPARAAALT